MLCASFCVRGSPNAQNPPRAKLGRARNLSRVGLVGRVSCRKDPEALEFHVGVKTPKSAVHVDVKLKRNPPPITPNSTGTRPCRSRRPPTAAAKTARRRRGIPLRYPRVRWRGPDLTALCWNLDPTIPRPRAHPAVLVAVIPPHPETLRLRSVSASPLPALRIVPVVHLPRGPVGPVPPQPPGRPLRTANHERTASQKRCFLRYRPLPSSG